jgi:hypothetical protein
MIFFFISKIAIYLCPSYRTGEGFSPQKRTSSTSKNGINSIFYVCGSFLPSWIQIQIADPDKDPGTSLNPDSIRIRIRIHSTGKNNQ